MQIQLEFFSCVCVCVYVCVRGCVSRMRTDAKEKAMPTSFRIINLTNLNLNNYMVAIDTK